MSLKNKLKGFFLTTSALLALSSCPKYQNEYIHVPKEPLNKLTLEGETFDLEKATIVQYANYNSKNIVAFIMDQHYPDDPEKYKILMEQAQKIHPEIYRTLEELTEENNSKFMGLEGYDKEFSKESLKDVSKDTKVLYELIINSNKEQQQEFVKLICFNAGLCEASMAFEFVNGDNIFSEGVDYEDEKLTKALRLADKYTEVQIKAQQVKQMYNNKDKWNKLSKQEQKLLIEMIVIPAKEITEEFYKKVVEERSEVFVQNLLIDYEAWRQQGNESKVIILIGGSLHYSHKPGVAEYLDKTKTSYIILKPNSLND